MEQKPSPKPLTDNQQRWLNHIRAAEQAGQTLKDYASEHALTLSALYSYKAELKKRGHISSNHPAPFARVQNAPVSNTTSLRIQLLNGIRVEASDMTGTDMIVQLCHGLSRLL